MSLGTGHGSPSQHSHVGARPAAAPRPIYTVPAAQPVFSPPRPEDESLPGLALNASRALTVRSSRPPTASHASTPELLRAALMIIAGLSVCTLVTFTSLTRTPLEPRTLASSPPPVLDASEPAPTVEFTPTAAIVTLPPTPKPRSPTSPLRKLGKPLHHLRPH